MVFGFWIRHNIRRFTSDDFLQFRYSITFSFKETSLKIPFIRNMYSITSHLHKGCQLCLSQALVLKLKQLLCLPSYSWGLR